MLAATHALTGAVIAKISPSPILGIFFAFLSHPLLDLIPHWDLRTRHNHHSRERVIIYSLIDAGFGFTMGFWIMHKQVQPLILLATMFAAQLLDWLEAPYMILRWKFPPFSWVKTFQHYVHQKLTFPDGLLVQIILVFFLLLITK